LFERVSAEEIVVPKLGVFLALLGFLVTTPTPAQHAPQSSSPRALPHAKIKCDDEPYVILTADAERALPLREVARAECNERVTVLSDPQGYTVRVATAEESVGYVARYELAFESPAKPSTTAPSAPASANAAPSGASTQAQTGQAVSGDKAPAKPRVYITDTPSWTETGGFGNPSSVGPGKLYGGYNPEMTDVYQDFTSDCPAVMVVQEKSNADYVVLFDKGTSKKGLTGLAGLVKVNKVTVLSRKGETLVSKESHSADTVVRAACDAMAQSPGAHR
jgi:hypothetical protein